MAIVDLPARNLVATDWGSRPLWTLPLLLERVNRINADYNAEYNADDRAANDTNHSRRLCRWPPCSQSCEFSLARNMGGFNCPLPLEPPYSEYTSPTLPQLQLTDFSVIRILGRGMPFLTLITLSLSSAFLFSRVSNLLLVTRCNPYRYMWPRWPNGIKGGVLGEPCEVHVEAGDPVYSEKKGTQSDQRDMYRMGKVQQLRRNLRFFTIFDGSNGDLGGSIDVCSYRLTNPFADLER